MESFNLVRYDFLIYFHNIIYDFARCVSGILEYYFYQFWLTHSIKSVIIVWLNEFNLAVALIG